MTKREIFLHIQYGVKIYVNERNFGCVSFAAYQDGDFSFVVMDDMWFYENFTLSKKPKFMLRPLSDLCSIISTPEDGEIYPIDFWDELATKWRVKLHNELKNMAKYNYCDGYLPAFVTEKLLEWHFDIFGLIEKGEAVNLNNFI